MENKKNKKNKKTKKTKKQKIQKTKEVSPDSMPLIAKDENENNEWKVGDYCMRKNKKCAIISIDNTKQPPVAKIFKIKSKKMILTDVTLLTKINDFNNINNNNNQNKDNMNDNSYNDSIERLQKQNILLIENHQPLQQQQQLHQQQQSQSPAAQSQSQEKVNEVRRRSSSNEPMPIYPLSPKHKKKPLESVNINWAQTFFKVRQWILKQRTIDNLPTDALQWANRLKNECRDEIPWIFAMDDWKKLGGYMTQIDIRKMFLQPNEPVLYTFYSRCLFFFVTVCFLCHCVYVCVCVFCCVCLVLVCFGLTTVVSAFGIVCAFECERDRVELRFANKKKGNKWQKKSKHQKKTKQVQTKI